MSTLQQLKLDYDFRPPPDEAEGAEVIVPQVRYTNIRIVCRCPPHSDKYEDR